MQRRVRRAVYAAAFFTVLTFLFSAATLCAQELVVAQTADGHWQTDGYAFVSPGSTTLVFVDFGKCLVQGAQATLLAGGAFKAKNIGNFQCSDAKEFYTLPAPIDADAFTHLRFNDGRTKVSIFVPPVSALQPDGWIRLSPISNDADTVTTVNVFPKKAAQLEFEIYDGLNAKIATETCDIAPPVTQCKVAKVFTVGSITIRQKSPGVGCVGCGPAALPGFVIVSALDGGNSRVMHF